MPPLLLDDPRQLSGTALGAWRGPTDLAARVFLLWDEQFLYVAAVVRDDWHRPLSGTSPRVVEVPPADSLFLAFDPNRDTREVGADAGRSEDREYWLAEVEEQGRKVVEWDRLRGVARYAPGALSVVQHDVAQRRTTYEARLPWAEILPPGRTPSERDVFDLQVAVSDYDEPTDVLPQTRVGWTFGVGPRIDPALYGTVMLWGVMERPVAELPDFPAPPATSGDAMRPADWVALWRRVDATSPTVVDVESKPPAAAGGLDRVKLLRDLDRHHASFPRVDFLEYHGRVHRRMQREVAGIVANGLPFFWNHALEEMAQEAAKALPQATIRIFRIPAGGWLIRSHAANFAIDPAGADVAPHLWGALDFVLLTSPRDVTKRNDQALLRLIAAKRRVFTHQQFHLPAIDASDLPLVSIGDTYQEGELRIRVLGITEGELVSATCGYEIEWPDGALLIHSGESAPLDENWRPAPGARPTDVLLLSPRHPDAAELAATISARYTLLDDVLSCASRAGPQPRTSLEQAFELQSRLRPLASVIVGPGESVDVTLTSLGGR